MYGGEDTLKVLTIGGAFVLALLIAARLGMTALIPITAVVVGMTALGLVWVVARRRRGVNGMRGSRLEKVGALEVNTPPVSRTETSDGTDVEVPGAEELEQPDSGGPGGGSSDGGSSDPRVAFGSVAPPDSPHSSMTDAQYLAKALNLYDNHDLSPGASGILVDDYWIHNDVDACNARIHAPWEDVVSGSFSFLVDSQRSSRIQRWIQLRSGGVVTKPSWSSRWLWMVFDPPQAEPNEPHQPSDDREWLFVSLASPNGQQDRSISA